jgi:acyl dehydratase
MVEKLYLEDLNVGQRFTSATYLITEEQIKSFAREFDPQPFHLDDAAAQNTVFRGLAASGWHTAAVAMKLLVTSGLPLGNGIIGLGGDLSWPKPTRPGVRSTTLNQKGEAVHEFTSKVLVFKRDKLPTAD